MEFKDPQPAIMKIGVRSVFLSLSYDESIKYALNLIRLVNSGWTLSGYKEAEDLTGVNDKVKRIPFNMKVLIKRRRG